MEIVEKIQYCLQQKRGLTAGIENLSGIANAMLVPVHQVVQNRWLKSVKFSQKGVEMNQVFEHNHVYANKSGSTHRMFLGTSIGKTKYCTNEANERCGIKSDILCAHFRCMKHREKLRVGTEDTISFAAWRDWAHHEI